MSEALQVRRDPIYLAGPTASGKSSAALFLAKALDGEIISVDSMQVYRGMDIGTAKSSLAEREFVRHHLLDVAEVSERFDVARYLELARAAEQEILSRGKRPIYCGGTGFYFNALVNGVGSSPPSDPVLRKTLEEVPLEKLLLELEVTDSTTFERIDKSNRRRVLRAVEVGRLTGTPFSSHRAIWKAPTGGVWIGLRRNRADINIRIEQRVDVMFERGLVEETELLLEKGLERNQTAMQALGYRQVVGLLRQEQDLKSTVLLVKQKTRQYAKRQMTWFERQLNLQWLDLKPDDKEKEIAERILDLSLVPRLTGPEQVPME